MLGIWRPGAATSINAALNNAAVSGEAIANVSKEISSVIDIARGAPADVGGASAGRNGDAVRLSVVDPPSSAAQTIGAPRASPSRAINPEYRRVGEAIAVSKTSAPPMIVTPERERVTAV